MVQGDADITRRVTIVLVMDIPGLRHLDVCLWNLVTAQACPSSPDRAHLLLKHAIAI